MKNPSTLRGATPLVLLVLAIATLVNITIHASVLLAPYLYQALVATLKFTKALLQTAFASLESVGVKITYYFYPITEEHPLDTLTGALLSDLAPRRPLKSSLARKILIGATGLGRAVAYLGKAGVRICE